VWVWPEARWLEEEWPEVRWPEEEGPEEAPWEGGVRSMRRERGEWEEAKGAAAGRIGRRQGH
jgi:hypothetical protein